MNLDTVVDNIPTLNQEDCEMIEGRITVAEAKVALSGMKNNKSPGSDGYTVEFFKFFFSDLGHFLVRSVNLGFTRQQLSVTQKQGIITCIPKDGKPKQLLKNWRPISLLNVSYKITSACIANRIKIMLPKIIHKDQRGFMKGRYIGENIRMLYDVLVQTEKEKIPGMLLLIDFEKAFDSVSWTFMQNALLHFNFGPDIRQWIKTFYNDVSTCVTVNGHLSRWFHIKRGVRQGDPLSPYLFLICAEVMSTMIRENDRIKGIKIRDYDVLLNQFADDTSLCLDGSEESLEEAVRVLERFAGLSGLKMNMDKTQIIWIGSRKNSGIRFLRDKNFCWDPGIFKVLGVKFTTNIEQISNLNFENKIQEIKQLLASWNRRLITPFGKITVLKTLAVSKLTHLFINLPDPSQAFLKELDTIFFNFLWNDKRHKIKKKVMCQAYLEGGLKMINVFTFLAALKISWLGRVRKEDSDVGKLICACYTDFMKTFHVGGEFANIMMERMHNPFWKDVMKHYKQLCTLCKPSQDDFVSECIYYNLHIKINKRTIFNQEWYDNGIYQIGHLLDNQGNFLHFRDFQVKYPRIRTNFLTYMGIINSIKQYQRRERNNYKPGYNIKSPKVWQVIVKGNNFVQDILKGPVTIPTGVLKWNRTFLNLEWHTIYKQFRKPTLEAKLRWFQFRIIHRILPTRRFLFLSKVVESEECALCGQSEETIEHLFWDCNVSKTFWDDLLTLLKDKCHHCQNLNLTKRLILFNVEVNVVTDDVVDLLLLLAKYYIYICKWNESRPDVTAFIRMFKSRYNIEKYVNAVRDRTVQFNQMWMPYKRLLD